MRLIRAWTSRWLSPVLRETSATIVRRSARSLSRAAKADSRAGAAGAGDEIGVPSGRLEAPGSFAEVLAADGAAAGTGALVD